MWIGPWGESESAAVWGEEFVYWKVKGKFLFLLFPHLFMAENFQFSEMVFVSNWPTAFCILSQACAGVCVLEWREILQKFSSSLSLFYVYRVAAVKFSTYVKNYMYGNILNPIFWRTWKPHSERVREANFYIYTHSLSSFFPAIHP